jgi:hypothetical protein
VGQGGPPTDLNRPGTGQWSGPRPKGTDDPLAEAEAALKKLRVNPGDKQAAEALERALQRLKKRAKPEGKTENLQAR